MSTPPYYPTDLTEEQGTLLVTLLPARKWQPGGPGRPPCDLRQVLNGLWDLLKTGCQGRLRPREFGKWTTGSRYFKRGRETGVGAKLREALRQRSVNARAGKQRPRRGVWIVRASRPPPKPRRAALTGASGSKAANASW